VIRQSAGTASMPYLIATLYLPYLPVFLSRRN
jgi:hypothetical protein